MTKPESSTPTAPTSKIAGRLWRGYLLPYRAQMALAGAFMVGLAGAELSFVLLTEWIFSGLDSARGGRFTSTPEDVMLWGPILTVVLGIAQAGFFYLQAVTSQNMGAKVLRDLQNNMFQQILRFDLAQSRADGGGQLVSRFTNDMTILRTALIRAPAGARDIVRLVGLIGALLWIDWVLFVCVLLIYPFIGLPITIIGKRIRKLGRAAQAQLGDMTGVLAESVAGQRMVKTYRLEDYEAERMGGVFETRYKLLNKLIRVRSANEPIITVIGSIAIAAIIGVAAFRIGSGQMTGPNLVAFLVAMAMVSQPARGLGTLNAVIQEGMAALERVFDVIDREPTITEAPDASDKTFPKGVPVSVTLSGVTFGYEADQPVLHDVSFNVPAGKTIALVGPSGGGKSSIFGLIPRLYDPLSGAITLDGVDVRRMRIGAVRDAVGFVSQDATLFDDTVAQNICFGNDAPTQDDIEAAAKAAAAHDFILGLPQGYQTRVGEAGGNLSGGQRQRIALARAFLKDAPVLLLDEATAALDAESERVIEKALERLAAERTTLIIAHRLSTVRHADEIIVIDRGRIIERGRHSELIAKGGLYARLVALQLREDTEEPAK